LSLASTDASPQPGRHMILNHVGRLATDGVAAGFGAAFILGRFAGSLLFRVRGSDPAVMPGAVTVVIAVSLAAALLPACRASRIDPARALRWE
jgi:putative ABC transport system permease protein